MKTRGVQRRLSRPAVAGAVKRVEKRKKVDAPSKKRVVRRVKTSVMSKKGLERKKQKWSSIVTTIILTIGAAFLAVILILNFLLPGIWDLEDNYNLLLVNKNGRELKLIHFNTEFKVVKEVAIDPGLKIRNFAGEERAMGGLLGEMIEQGRDEQFLAAQYSFALEESLDEVLVMERENTDWQQRLSRGELQKILWTNGENKTHREMFFFLNKGVSWSFETLTEADWRWFHQESFSKQWRNVQCSIAVLNATTTPGLAQKIWNLLSKDGHKMMKMANFGEHLERTTVYYDRANSECLPIVQRAMRVLPLVPEVVDDGGGVANRHKASIVVVAGKDLTE